ncbi:WxL domain-containing protein [Lactiplantibacillus pingfangensis]|uniref:WxL domain-containing protein n=1 Tax=Lactiplantibacillus pingfangensis TaxID=2559915 RepID=UPI0010F85096|nr:WxL domain-containing protein [Lactiplantibacillus pingfangensis]
MKKVIGSLLMSSALLGTVVAPLVANADANTTGKTNVTTTFTKSTQTVSPVDPSNPDKTTDPGDGNNGAAAGGDLSLIYVPASLDFGTSEIDVSNDKALDLDKTSAATTLWESNAVIEASDVRGTNAGWSVTVKGDTLTGTDGATIKGATLTLPEGTVSNSGNQTKTNANGAYATAQNVDLATTDSTVAGVQVLGAKENNGAGVTVSNLNPDNIKLNIPANTAKAETYKTTLNWTMNDTPGN